MARDWQWYNPASMLRSMSDNDNERFQQELAMKKLIAELPYNRMSQADQASQEDKLWGRTGVTEAQRLVNEINQAQAAAHGKQARAQMIQANAIKDRNATLDPNEKLRALVELLKYTDDPTQRKLLQAQVAALTGGAAPPDTPPLPSLSEAWKSEVDRELSGATTPQEISQAKDRAISVLGRQGVSPRAGLGISPLTALFGNESDAFSEFQTRLRSNPERPLRTQGVVSEINPQGLGQGVLDEADRLGRGAEYKQKLMNEYNDPNWLRRYQQYVAWMPTRDFPEIGFLNQLLSGKSAKRSNPVKVKMVPPPATIGF